MPSMWPKVGLSAVSDHAGTLFFNLRTVINVYPLLLGNPVYDIFIAAQVEEDCALHLIFQAAKLHFASVILWNCFSCKRCLIFPGKHLIHLAYSVPALTLKSLSPWFPRHSLWRCYQWSQGHLRTVPCQNSHTIDLCDLSPYAWNCSQYKNIHDISLEGHCEYTEDALKCLIAQWISHMAYRFIYIFLSFYSLSLLSLSLLLLHYLLPILL